MPLFSLDPSRQHTDFSGKSKGSIIGRRIPNGRLVTALPSLHLTLISFVMIGEYLNAKGQLDIGVSC